MVAADQVTFREFRSRYNTEETCRAELFRQRFRNRFVCPKCGCVEYYPILTRNTYQCRACRHQASVTVGTVMHRTSLPLTVRFWAIYLCATDKRGISAVQLGRTLGICYDSAWHLLMRIRKAMRQRDEEYRLCGIVEMDDCFIGNPTHDGKRGRGTDKQKAVIALSKSKQGAALLAHMKVVQDMTAKSLQDSMDALIAKGSEVECDGYRSYLNLKGVTVKAVLHNSARAICERFLPNQGRKLQPYFVYGKV